MKSFSPIRMKARFILPFCMALPGLGSGCAEPRPDAIRFGVRHLGLAERSIVFEGCGLALEAEGFVVEDRDFFKGTLKSYPRTTELESRGGSAASTLIRREGRETALMHVVQEEQRGVVVYCQIKIERQSTESQRMRAAEMTGTDVPGSTPIDREGATTEEQNTVWTDQGRNRELEQRILDRMQRFVKELSVGEAEE